MCFKEKTKKMQKGKIWFQAKPEVVPSAVTFRVTNVLFVKSLLFILVGRGPQGKFTRNKADCSLSCWDGLRAALDT